MAEWSGSFDLQVPDVEDDGFVPDIDLDGDGTVDTMVLHGGVAGAFSSASGHGATGMAILSDLDGDGDADRATVFEPDGDYTAWVSSADLTDGADGRWHAVDRGSL